MRSIIQRSLVGQVVSRLGLALCLLSVVGSCAAAADKAAVQQGITKGTSYLKANLNKMEGSTKSLAFLAIFKGGEPAGSPLMNEAVAHVRAGFKDGKYVPPGEHVYQAAIDVTLLADVDAEKYQNEIQQIANYIVSRQLANGVWTYPPPQGDQAVDGDMSITHYACLGLWAAERAGIKIDPQVWQRLLTQMSKAQNPDGGYAYWPHQKVGDGEGSSMLNMSINGVGTIMIAMMNLDPKSVPTFRGTEVQRPGTPKPKAAEEKAPQGALEIVNLDEQQAEQPASSPGGVPGVAYPALQNCYRWVVPRFDVINKGSGWGAYYYYSLERMASLANIQKIGDRDWFNECADYLLSQQQADGSWRVGNKISLDNETSLCVLFLTRSTAKVLKRRPEEPTMGGGLLSGGRGLPDDLKDVDANGNVKKKKEKTSLDDLLAALQDPDKVNLEETQSELVQQIQLGDKKQLIGKTDQLLQLAEHPNADIRRTAIWAIGRTGDLSLARFAILGLDDPDRGVMTESHLALCWTARKPRAFNLPVDPLADLAADASEDQKSAAVESWRRQALRLWGEWYLRNRPYKDRGDEFETNLRNRLLQLN